VTGWYLAIAILLLIGNGFFVGAEFALIAARRPRMEQLAEQGDRAAAAALRSMDELSFVLAGTQLGITMCSLGLGYVAEPAVAHLIESALGPFELPETVVHTIALVIALGIVVFLHMVIGEMAPKNIAISEPERAARAIAFPYRLFGFIFRPIIRLLNGVAFIVLRMMGIKPKETLVSAHSPQELGFLISESAKGGMLEKFEYRLLSGVVEFRERDAAAAMAPRTAIVAIPKTATPEDVERLVLESGHSRYPVYAGDLDEVIGFFHVKDLLSISDSARKKPIPRRLIRPMLIVPESRKLADLLLDMRRQRSHFALVIDEHGGTSGVVALEDVLEELVGEIRDEYDAGEHGIEQLAEDRFLAPGTLRIDEAAERLGVELPESDDYETIAGFLMAELGRIPKRRDSVEHGNWRLRVRTMHRRRVVQVLIERIEPEEGTASVQSASGSRDRTS
jgi:CBS domain containing-hemolysin-like protein